MKKIIALFMAVTLCASMAGCGKEKDVINEDDIAQAMAGLGEIAEGVAESVDGNSSKNMEKYEKVKTDVTNCLASLPGADINIKSYAIFDGYDNNKILTVAADFTNKTDRDNYIKGICGIKAYQNDVSLDIANHFMNPTIIEKDLATAIRPGKTLEIMFSIELRNEKEDVEIEFEDYYNYSGETASCTINLSK